MSGAEQALLAQLAAWVEQTLGATIDRQFLIDGGRSRLICGIDARIDGRPVPLLVRKETGFGPHSGTRFTMAREAALLRSLEGQGVAAPRIHAVAEDGSALVMERLAGRAVMPTEEGERQAVIESFAEALARLHATDLAALGTVLRHAPSAAQSALFDLDDYEFAYRSLCDRHAIIDQAISWLKGEVARIEGPAVLTHGDAGPGNFMHENGRVTGLIDWEMTHVGNYHDDLAWLWFRTTLLKQDRAAEPWIEACLRAAGASLQRDALVWCIVMVILRCTICCGVRQAHDPLHDDTRPAQLRNWLAMALRDAARPRFIELPGLPGE